MKLQTLQFYFQFISGFLFRKASIEILTRFQMVLLIKTIGGFVNQNHFSFFKGKKKEIQSTLLEGMMMMMMMTEVEYAAASQLSRGEQRPHPGCV